MTFFTAACLSVFVVGALIVTALMVKLRNGNY
ncbi:hypothetical protein C7459_104131 [Tumebacillus permanentifrigoris]|uniref:Uncharacterized protein n=1 Tax=Tumebacillus permanentifrigoris TaxID=378543 RepID=A0A316DC52_9BACL|nr:hypothetical protein C7459_104131 [Tumebacillus permanentifrigoris]